MNSISFSCFSDGSNGKMAKPESHCLLNVEKIAGLLFLRPDGAGCRVCVKYLLDIEPFDCVFFFVHVQV